MREEPACEGPGRSWLDALAWELARLLLVAVVACEGPAWLMLGVLPAQWPLVEGLGSSFLLAAEVVAEEVVLEVGAGGVNTTRGFIRGEFASCLVVTSSVSSSLSLLDIYGRLFLGFLPSPSPFRLSPMLNNQKEKKTKLTQKLGTKI